VCDIFLKLLEEHVLSHVLYRVASSFGTKVEHLNTVL